MYEDWNASYNKLIERQEKRNKILKYGALGLGALATAYTGSYLFSDDFFNAWLFGGNEISDGITIHGFATQDQQEAILEGIEIFNKNNPDWFEDFGEDNPLDIYTELPEFSPRGVRRGYVEMSEDDEMHVAFPVFTSEDELNRISYTASHEAYHLLNNSDGGGDEVFYSPSDYIDLSSDGDFSSFQIVGGNNGLIFYDDDGNLNNGYKGSKFLAEFIEFANADDHLDLEVVDVNGEGKTYEIEGLMTTAYGKSLVRFYNSLNDYVIRSGGDQIGDPKLIGDAYINGAENAGGLNGFATELVKTYFNFEEGSEEFNKKVENLERGIGEYFLSEEDYIFERAPKYLVD